VHVVGLVVEQHATYQQSVARRFRSVKQLAWLAVAFAAVLTALTLADVVRFEYRNAAAHLVLDTIDACVALLVSFLLYGRLLRSRRVQDFLLLQALLLLAVANVSTSAALLSAINDRGERLEVWLALSLRVAAAMLVVTAAVMGPRRLVPQVSALQLLAPLAGLVGVCIVGLSALSSRLPQALDTDAAPTLLSGHAALVGAQVLTVVCFLVAAYLFTLQARGSTDHFVRLLAPACVLAGFARINYALFPSLYSQWLYTGDVLRTAFYLVLLVGAAQEIRAFWGAQAAAAVIEDRRRLARELHDGVVQELGYIRSESGALRTLDPPRTERILGACDRALDEARQAVEMMGRSGGEEEPLGFTVHRAARQVADRFGVALDLELDDTVTADQGQRHALLRIVREAVGNAARHGEATRLKIELQRVSNGQRRLVVCDDGKGFDVSAAMAQQRGFGLTSMRERSEGLPGTFEVESAPSAGTTVMVTW
jgi:signal transduction histidine kinase